jgi:hypothetical protein
MVDRLRRSNANSAPGFGIPAFEAARSNPSLASEQVLKFLHEVVGRIGNDGMIAPFPRGNAFVEDGTPPEIRR